MPDSFERRTQVAIHAYVLLEALVLHFEKEIPFAENIAQTVGALLRLIVFFGRGARLPLRHAGRRRER